MKHVYLINILFSSNTAIKISLIITGINARTFSDIKPIAGYINMLLLREWAPLSDLFNILPSKVQNGIFPQDVKITCIDALEDFLVLGTNVGIVYWYDRKKKTLQRLRCEVDIKGRCLIL